MSTPISPPIGIHYTGTHAPTMPLTNSQSTQNEATQKACNTKTNHMRTAK